MRIKILNLEVERFIKSLNPQLSSKLGRTIDMLEKYGSQIGMPYSRSLGGGMFELRIKGNQQVRLIYVFRKDCAWVIHAFFKKSQSVSKKDLSLARSKISLLDSI